MYKVYANIQEAPVLDTGLPCFCDIESDGLYINPRIIQIYQPSTQPEVIILDLDKINITDAKEYLKPLHTVWYNASYDLGTLNIVPTKIDDMFYATKIAYPEFQEFSLDIVMSKLGLDHYYQNIDKKAMQKARFLKGARLSHAQYTYASTDCLVLNEIYQLAKIQEVIATNMAYRVDILSLIYTIQWQENGLEIIKPNWDKYYKDAIDRKAKYEALLPKGFNTRSHTQVKRLLGTDSSDKPTLTRLIVNEGSEKAEYILNLRKAMNDLSKLASYNHTKVKGRFNPYGTATGRYSCTGGDIPNGINMQNYPRQYKALFGTNDDDYIMLGADYSTLEVRLACMVYGEPSMYRALKEGLDLHRYTYSLMANIPYDSPDITQEHRNLAKPVNFGFTFGLSAKNFVEYAFDLFGLKYTLEEATKFRKQFFTAYPEFESYHTKVFRAMSKGNYIATTALGRKVKPRLGTDAINIPVQGSGGECTKLAIHYMVKSNPDSLKYIVNAIHDAIYLKVPKVSQDYWAELLHDSMIRAWEELSKSSLFVYHDVPMLVDVGRGKTIKDT